MADKPYVTGYLHGRKKAPGAMICPGAFFRIFANWVIYRKRIQFCVLID